MKLKLKAVDHIRPFNCDYEAADNLVWISKPNFEFCGSVTVTDEAKGMVNYIRPFNCDFEAATNFLWISNSSALQLLHMKLKVWSIISVPSIVTTKQQTMLFRFRSRSHTFTISAAL